MPVSARSRLALSRVQTRDDSALLFIDRPALRYRSDANNRVHLVAAGDTLWTLADKYFPGLARAAEKFWLIADYQDPPILDPTLRLEPGTTLIIPPESVFFEALGESRRDSEPLW